MAAQRPDNLRTASDTLAAPTMAVRKRAGACIRCRHRKVRCDGALPACANCVKAGVECQGMKVIDTKTQGSHVSHLEERIQYLETQLRGHGHGSPLGKDLDSGPPRASNSNSPGAPVAPKTPVVVRHEEMPASTERSGPSPSLDYGSSQVPAHASPAVSASLSIGPTEPIAHEVGLLSLANSTEPKYVGPSSGVTFARLMYAAAPQTQGLSASLAQPGNVLPLTQSGENALGSVSSRKAPVLSEREMYYFIDAYFETFHPLYPFLNESEFSTLVERCDLSAHTSRATTPGEHFREHEQPSYYFDRAQLYLVLFLGATTLESKLSQDFAASTYLSAAMKVVSKLQLHDSLIGVQVLLLLVLSSLHSPHGLNAWYLKSTIIASCIDLGLQRKRSYHESTPRGSVATVDEAEKMKRDLRSGVFWSAYSLDRTLSVVLGRPLTLRDEAIDIEYPGVLDSTEVDRPATAIFDTEARQDDQDEPAPKKLRGSESLPPAVYSFRFDRIIAEIKLMLFRVAQSPRRFPWPVDHDSWQDQTNETCSRLLQEMHHDLSRSRIRNRGTGREVTLLWIELKYHHCMMLLYRPSPAIPRPTALALKFCFESAMETIRIHSELHRFGNFPNSWLHAHTTFVSGITILYCLWVSPQIRSVTPFQLFSHYTYLCVRLLTYLGKTWSVAENASKKFETLAEITKSSWQQNVLTSNVLQRPSTEDPQQVAWDPEKVAGNPLDLPVFEMPDDPDLDWSSFDVDYGSTNVLLDELGEMSDWFFLDWLGQ